MRVTKRQLNKIIAESLGLLSEQPNQSSAANQQATGDALETAAKELKKAKEGIKVTVKVEGDKVTGTISQDGTTRYGSSVTIEEYKKYMSMVNNNHGATILNKLFKTATQDGFKHITDVNPALKPNIATLIMNKGMAAAKSVSEINPAGGGSSRQSSSRYSKSNPKNKTVQSIQKIIDKYETLTNHDGDWGKKTQKAWENYINGVSHGNKDRHGNQVKPMNFERAFKEHYPDEDFESIKKSILRDWQGTAKKLGFDKGNVKTLLEFLKKIHTAKSGAKKETEGGTKEPAETGKSREPAKKGKEQQKKQQKRLPVTLLTDEQAADSRYVQKFWNQMVDDVMKSATGKRMQDNAKERDINAKYGLKRQKNDVFTFKTSGGKTVRYNSKSKTIISEGLSRGALYRRRYYGRY